jgi:hypothetical protein
LGRSGPCWDARVATFEAIGRWHTADPPRLGEGSARVLASLLELEQVLMRIVGGRACSGSEAAAGASRSSSAAMFARAINSRSALISRRSAARPAWVILTQVRVRRPCPAALSSLTSPAAAKVSRCLPRLPSVRCSSLRSRLKSARATPERWSGCRAGRAGCRRPTWLTPGGRGPRRRLPGCCPGEGFGGTGWPSRSSQP